MRNKEPSAPPAASPSRPPSGRKPSVWLSWNHGSHGTPVIVTPNGGLPELITHGRNGWIAQEPSVESLAETLHTALKQEERWPAMGAHGQQLLSSTYSPAAWLRSMEALLGELRVFHSSSTPPTS